jgi:hypothetical protein
MDRVALLKAERSAMTTLYRTLQQSGAVKLDEEGHVVSVELSVGDVVNISDKNYLDRVRAAAKIAKPQVVATDDLSDVFLPVIETEGKPAPVPEWLKAQMLKPKTFTAE